MKQQILDDINIGIDGLYKLLINYMILKSQNQIDFEELNYLYQTYKEKIKNEIL